jgi:hypothetical protein
MSRHVEACIIIFWASLKWNFTTYLSTRRMLVSARNAKLDRDRPCEQQDISSLSKELL